LELQKLIRVQRLSFISERLEEKVYVCSYYSYLIVRDVPLHIPDAV
jgi:repressor of nif and glnA expression